MPRKNTENTEFNTLSLAEGVLTQERGNKRLIETKAMLAAKYWLDQAVEGLRKAGDEDFLAGSLLACASYHRWCLAVACVDAGNTGEMVPDNPVFRKLNTGYKRRLPELEYLEKLVEESTSD